MQKLTSKVLVLGMLLANTAAFAVESTPPAASAADTNKPAAPGYARRAITFVGDKISTAGSMINNNRKTTVAVLAALAAAGYGVYYYKNLPKDDEENN